MFRWMLEKINKYDTDLMKPKYIPVALWRTSSKQKDTVSSTNKTIRSKMIKIRFFSKETANGATR